MDFYISTFFSSIFIIIPAIISYKNDRDHKHRGLILFISISGVFLSIYSNYNSEQKSKENEVIANKNHRLYTNLLVKNLNSAHNIIDSLKISIHNTKNLIVQNNSILTTQHSSVSLLNKQLNTTAKIQNNVINSGKMFVTTIGEATKSINDNLTGGDSYCDVELETNTLNDYRLRFINHFKNTIPNAAITLYKYEDILSCPVIITPTESAYDSNCTDKYMVVANTMSFAPNDQVTFKGSETFLIPDFLLHKLCLKMQTAANTYYIDFIYKLSKNSSGSYQYRLYKLVNGKPVDIKMVNYPKTFIMSADWDNLFKIKVYNMKIIKG